MVEVSFAVEPTTLVHRIGGSTYNPAVEAQNVPAVDLISWIDTNTDGEFRLCTRKFFGEVLDGDFENSVHTYSTKAADHVLVCGLVGGHPTTVLRPR